jgi:pilus assembly protein Flp/PilA
VEFFEEGAGPVFGTKNLVRRLAKDEHGAALIEYTVIIGILIVAVLGLVIAVGNWVNGIWTTVNHQLS